MREVKFFVPVEEQDRWKKALEGTPETEATMALLEDIERCVTEGDTVAYGRLDPTLTNIFAKLGKR